MLKLRVLILDDDYLDAWIISKEIKKNNPLVTCKMVHTKSDFIKYYDPFQPDIIISDYNMPEFTGMDAILYSRKNNIPVPIIIVSGGLKQSQIEGILKNGASGFVSKDKISTLYPEIKRVLMAE